MTRESMRPWLWCRATPSCHWQRRTKLARSVPAVGSAALASQTRPALTTIRQDIAAGAARLADLLLRRMGGENTASVVLPPELVGRQTA